MPTGAEALAFKQSQGHTPQMAYTWLLEILVFLTHPSPLLSIDPFMITHLHVCRCAIREAAGSNGVTVPPRLLLDLTAEHSLDTVCALSGRNLPEQLCMHLCVVSINGYGKKREA